MFFIATNELFLLNFFLFSKKKLLRNIWSCSEYLTLFNVNRMFTLRNLVSTIMKARVYRMYKILTGSREDSGSWPKDIFCKRYLVSLCPGVSLCPRLCYEDALKITSCTKIQVCFLEEYFTYYYMRLFLSKKLLNWSYYWSNNFWDSLFTFGPLDILCILKFIMRLNVFVKSLQMQNVFIRFLFFMKHLYLLTAEITSYINTFLYFQNCVKKLL